jgi:small-conductance mechanosensitive channel
VKFEIGDTVQVGTRVGRITDIGTVLIQVKTNDGGSRMACPWEVVRILRCHEGRLRDEPERTANGS